MAASFGTQTQTIDLSAFKTATRSSSHATARNSARSYGINGVSVGTSEISSAHTPMVPSNDTSRSRTNKHGCKTTQEKRKDEQNPDEPNRNSNRKNLSMIQIECLSELTPLDMMDLSFGTADPTGHVVWLGAFFFLEIFVRDLGVDSSSQIQLASEDAKDCFWRLSLDSDESQKPLQAEDTEASELTPHEMRHYLCDLRHALFPPDCTVLELGAGTGLSGLSLMAMAQRHKIPDGTLNCEERGPTFSKSAVQHCQSSTKFDGFIRPSLMVLTDADDDALELCRRNLGINIRKSDSGEEAENVKIQKLEWGQGNAVKMLGKFNNESARWGKLHLNPNSHGSTDQFQPPISSTPMRHLPSTYDVVFATDVLYDLSLLTPLLATASETLRQGGHFILSHIPRASVSPSILAEINKNTDQSKHGLEEVDQCNDQSWNREKVENVSSFAVGTSQQLESIIIGEAAKFYLTLSFPKNNSQDEKNNKKNEKGMIFRPSLLPYLWGDVVMPPSKQLLGGGKYSCQKMMDVGAAILVFQKQSHCYLALKEINK